MSDIPTPVLFMSKYITGDTYLTSSHRIRLYITSVDPPDHLTNNTKWNIQSGGSSRKEKDIATVCTYTANNFLFICYTSLYPYSRPAKVEPSGQTQFIHNNPVGVV